MMKIKLDRDFFFLIKYVKTSKIFFLQIFKEKCPIKKFIKKN